MELPDSLLESSIEERKIYFFTKNATIGSPNHMHVCIRLKDRVLLFSTCTSQTDTVYRLGQFKGWDMNTFPCFKKNEQNKFDRELTFVNCNNIIQCDKDEFLKFIKNGSIIPLDGTLNEREMNLISNGIQKSITVAQEIKELFL